MTDERYPYRNKVWWIRGGDACHENVTGDYVPILVFQNEEEARAVLHRAGLIGEPRLDLWHVRNFLAEFVKNSASWTEGEAQQNGPEYHPGCASAWWCQRCGAAVESDDPDTVPEFDHYANCEADIARNLLRDLDKPMRGPGSLVDQARAGEAEQAAAHRRAREEIAELREALRLANVDAFNAEAEANANKDALAEVVKESATAHERAEAAEQRGAERERARIVAALRAEAGKYEENEIQRYAILRLADAIRVQGEMAPKESDDAL